ncbi:MAG: glycosyltransferase [Lachnospiraceae bacterium]|nr:glycosyltransferase [Lachnospiraceae bacterium]
MSNFKAGVVLVTYNRLQELKKSLPCYEKQTKKPVYMIVVDNCSNDGTKEFLEKWENEDCGIIKKVITLPENRGGSGGFYAGLKEASVRTDADWIWVADDDAFPELYDFEKAELFVENHAELMKEVSAFCGMCEYEGRVASVQRARFSKTVLGRHEVPIKESEYRTKEFFEIDLYSFVGTFLRRDALLKAGLPREDFFIYQDDYEHAVRMGKQGKLLCVPEILIHHKDNYMYNREVSWRDYYATRNIVILYKTHIDKKSLRLRILRRLLAAYSSGNKMKIKVIKEAIADGKAEKTGIHPVYKPGWKG